MRGSIQTKSRVIYVAGSLRNKNVPNVANELRKINKDWEIFDSWFAPGPHADDFLRDYCKGKGLSYKETLQDWAATHIYAFDRKHILRSTDIVMVMPCGKSGHLELGFGLGRGKRGYIYFTETPKRVDVMYQFATDIFFNLNELISELKKYD